MDLVKPRALRLGDTIGIVSTSSPVTAKELARLSAQLLARRYNVRKADGLLDRAGCRIEFGLRGRQPVLRYLEDLVSAPA